MKNLFGVWIVIAFIFAVLISVGYLVRFSPPEETTNSIPTLRRIIAECSKTPDRHPHIETIWDAPVGQPRKPIEWRVTCKKTN